MCACVCVCARAQNDEPLNSRTPAPVHARPTWLAIFQQSFVDEPYMSEQQCMSRTELVRNAAPDQPRLLRGLVYARLEKGLGVAKSRALLPVVAQQVQHPVLPSPPSVRAAGCCVRRAWWGGGCVCCFRFHPYEHEYPRGNTHIYAYRSHS